jgi:DNA-binding NarL/FixJ family response regulator
MPELAAEAAPGSVDQIRILIVEDHAMVADAFTAALNREPDMEVVSHGVSVAEAEHLAARDRPDVVVIDFRLPDGDGADAIDRVRRVHPDAKVLVVTSASDDRSLTRALASDTDGYLLKDQPVEELLDAVRVVAGGGSAYSPALVGRIVSKMVGGRKQPDQLSEREVEILQMLATGRSTADMATDMHISVNTVRNHVQRVLMKLGTHSRLEAVADGIRTGLIHSP